MANERTKKKKTREKIKRNEMKQHKTKYEVSLFVLKRNRARTIAVATTRREKKRIEEETATHTKKIYIENIYL